MIVQLWNAKDRWPMLLQEVVKKKKTDLDNRTRKTDSQKINKIELLLTNLLKKVRFKENLRLKECLKTGKLKKMIWWNQKKKLNRNLNLSKIRKPKKSWWARSGSLKMKSNQSFMILLETQRRTRMIYHQLYLSLFHIQLFKQNLTLRKEKTMKE